MVVRARVACVVAACAVWGVWGACVAWGSDGAALAGLRTAAEESEYARTATHSEVVAMLDAIAAAAPGRVRRASMGKSVEGRDLALLIVSDPPVATAEEAAALVEREGRVVCFLFANIHAGEVDGKEALPMLVRDLLVADPKGVLTKLVLVVLPIYNADGNERFGPIDVTRPGQNGPSAGAGQRHNAMDLDLNRDYVKLEAPETRAMVRLFNEWNPGVVVDCHTTNGSYHRYPLTYAGPKVPAGGPGLIAFTRGRMFPAVAGVMRATHGIDTFIYGDFEGVRTDNPRGHTKWETFPAHARYSTGYVGLRGRISVLSEAYSYATFKERVWATYHFCSEVLGFVAENRDEVRAALREAEAWGRGQAPGSGDVALRSRATAGSEKVTVRGWVEEQRNGRSIATQEARDYECELMDLFEATHSVARPVAYAVPASLVNVVENLRMHGIATRTLSEAVTVGAETYTIDSSRAAGRLFQGHAIIEAEATAARGSVVLPAGTVMVDLDQPLGALAAYLLEPECEDGLVAWNFLDEYVKPGSEYPVRRVMR